MVASAAHVTWGAPKPRKAPPKRLLVSAILVDTRTAGTS